jgi:predicted RNA-binding Zn ribbon-like protein
MDSDSPFAFELDSGRLCLDFVNTYSRSSGEHRHSYADLVAFARQAGLFSPDDAEWFSAEGERDPRAAAGVLRRALNLREALRAIFTAIAAGRRPSSANLALLNADLANSLPHARVLPSNRGNGGYVWGWHGRNMDAPVWPISRSAADLLVDDQDRPRIRTCNAPDCAWLFVDTSKNRSRQWCSMTSCGNREKARRHYQRLRAQRDDTATGHAAATAPAAGTGHAAADAERGARSGAAHGSGGSPSPATAARARRGGGARRRTV